MSLDTGEKIDAKVVAVLSITDNFIQWVETLGKTQQQPFRASCMLHYKWISGHAVAADDANLDVPDDEKNLLVTNPVEQQQIAQDHPKGYKHHEKRNNWIDCINPQKN